MNVVMNISKNRSINISQLIHSRLKNQIEFLDWNDTFLSMDHLRASFPDCPIEVATDDVSKHIPPFR